jgi:hypothetical protein
MRPLLMWNVPDPYESHEDADETPTAVEYVPPPHASHVDREDPTTSEYVPTWRLSVTCRLSVILRDL